MRSHWCVCFTRGSCFRQTFDIEMSPLPFLVDKMYHFIDMRFEADDALIQEQGLQWLQILTSANISIPFVLLLKMFKVRLKTFANWSKPRRVVIYCLYSDWMILGRCQLSSTLDRVVDRSCGTLYDPDKTELLHTHAGHPTEAGNDQLQHVDNQCDRLLYGCTPMVLA